MTDRRLLAAGVVVFALLIAYGIFAGLSSRPEPEVVEKVVKTPVAVAPDECVQALAAAEDSLEIASEALRASNEIAQAAADGDLETAQSLASDYLDYHARNKDAVLAFWKLDAKCRDAASNTVAP